MRSFKSQIAALLLAVCTIGQADAAMQAELQFVSTISTGHYNQGGAEISSYDPETQRIFFTGAVDNAITVVDISNPDSPEVVATIDLDTWGAGVNSVAVRHGIVAAAVEASPKTDPGQVVLFNTNGDFLNAVQVGALPDMLTFTHDGHKILVANEGEPNDAYTVDPEGSISIIDISNGADQASVVTADFHRFDGSEDSLRAAHIRIFGPHASTSQDFEPEYITTSNDSRTAWASIQEANAIAVIDIESGIVTDLLPLGFKDCSIEGNGFDASDRDNAINIVTHPVKEMYMPDGIASFSLHNQTYLVTANEGDTRGYAGFNEEARISSLALDTAAFPNGAALKANGNLGRLTVTNTLGDANHDGKFEELYLFGGRSFSIFSSTGQLIYDSGDQFEKKTAELLQPYFNSDHATNSTFDNRSDNKGPEPEGVSIGHIQGRIFAFINLERIGGVMIYDVTNPGAPVFAGYSNRRDFTYNLNANNVTQQDLDAVGDLGPEATVFIPAEESPNGNPLLLVSNEISGNVSIFNISITGEPTSHFTGYTETDNNHSLLITSARYNNEQIPAGWEIGVFTTANILAGSGIWPENGRLGLSAWGDEDSTEAVEGFVTGESMHFRLWDNISNREYPIDAVVNDGSLEWSVDGATSLSLDQLHTMNIELFRSWNLISVNVVPPQQYWLTEQGPDVALMLEQFGHNLQFVKDEHGHFFWPRYDFNNISFWDLTRGYQVKVDTAVHGSWTGLPIASDAPIPLSSGWNMIAYYPSYQLEASSPEFHVLSPILEHVILAKNRLGSFLRPSNNFSNMDPWRESQGYQVKVDANVVLNYPANEPGTDDNPASERNDNNHWSEPELTGVNMSVLISSVNANVGDQIAAFDIAGKIVGVGVVQSNGMCGLAVWGNDPTTDEVDGMVAGGAFTLRLWNAEQAVESELKINAVVGSLCYETDGFANVSAVGSVVVPGSFYMSQSYPNPFNASTRIAFGLPEASHVSIQVYDLSGRLAATLVNADLSAGNHSTIWNAIEAPAGIYMVKMKAGSFSSVSKLTLVK